VIPPHHFQRATSLFEQYTVVFAATRLLLADFRNSGEKGNPIGITLLGSAAPLVVVRASRVKGDSTFIHTSLIYTV
jgi:hypothetical protein